MSDGEAPAGNGLAYLTSRYPWVSHAFVLREVVALRERGYDVGAYTVHPTPTEALLSAADREEHARTEALQPIDVPRQLRSHLSALRRAPRQYLGTLRFALRTATGGVRSHLRQLAYFGEAVQLWDRARRRGFDHVHAHFANNGADIAMLAASLGRPGPSSWSFTMHATGLADVTQVKLALKARSASLVVCISDFTRAQLMLLTPPDQWPKLRVVRLGVDATRFVPAPDGRRRERDVPEVLYVGRLATTKNPLGLLEASAALHRDGLRHRLTLAGSGELGDMLAERVRALGLEEWVTLPGPVSQDDIVDRYHAADVFCLPSLYEGLPVVLMEAMACGLPVVTTHINGIPELVRDGVHGRLIAPGSTDAITQALRELLELPPERRQAMGAAGRERVIAEYDLARNVDQLVATLMETRSPIRSR